MKDWPTAKGFFRVYEAGDIVTVKMDGMEWQAKVLARHERIAGAQNPYYTVEGSTSPISQAHIVGAGFHN